MKKIRDFLNKKRKGMTLVELMIVVVIIGIVFAYAFVNAGQNTEKAKQARTAEDIAAITSAAAMYVAEADNQLQAISKIVADGSTVLNSKLSKPLAHMKDGWGNPYSIGTQTVPEANTKILVIDCATAGKKDLDNQPFTRKLDFTNVAD